MAHGFSNSVVWAHPSFSLLVKSLIPMRVLAYCSSFCNFYKWPGKFCRYLEIGFLCLQGLWLGFFIKFWEKMGRYLNVSQPNLTELGDSTRCRHDSHIEFLLVWRDKDRRTTLKAWYFSIFPPIFLFLFSYSKIDIPLKRKVFIFIIISIFFVFPPTDY